MEPVIRDASEEFFIIAFPSAFQGYTTAEAAMEAAKGYMTRNGSERMRIYSVCAVNEMVKPAKAKPKRKTVTKPSGSGPDVA